MKIAPQKSSGAKGIFQLKTMLLQVQKKFNDHFVLVRL